MKRLLSYILAGLFVALAIYPVNINAQDKKKIYDYKEFWGTYKNKPVSELKNVLGEPSLITKGNPDKWVWDWTDINNVPVKIKNYKSSEDKTYYVNKINVDVKNNNIRGISFNTSKKWLTDEEKDTVKISSEEEKEPIVKSLDEKKEPVAKPLKKGFTNEQLVQFIEEEENKPYLISIPIGDIRIKGDAMEEKLYGKPKNLKMGEKSASDLGNYKSLAKCGLIKLSEYQLPFSEYSTRGFKYKIEITSKGINASSGKNQNGEYIIKMGGIKIIKIVKISNYELPGGKRTKNGEDMKIIMATHKFYATAIGKECEPQVKNIEQKSLKIKALIKYDIFNDKYIYGGSDMGVTDEDGWKSHNIPE